MKRFRKIILLCAATSVLAFMAVITGKLYFSDYEYRLRTQHFNRILAGKETIMESCLRNMEAIISDSAHRGYDAERDVFNTARRNGIAIFEYSDDTLVNWSDDNFDVPLRFDDTLFAGPMVFLQNGWFEVKTVKAGNSVITGLLRLRTEYGFTNDIIRNGFEHRFRLSENVGFSFDADASEYHVSDGNGNFLFSLLFPAGKEINYLISIPLSFCVLSFIFLIWTIIAAGRMANILSRTMSAAVSAVSFALLYAALLLAGEPQVLAITGLFSPYRFSLNGFVPSLGHLLVLAVLTMLTAAVFFRDFPDFRKDRKTAFIIKTVYTLAAAVLFAVFHFMFNRLVSTSNISFEPYKVLELSWYSVAGFTALLLFLLSPYFILRKMFNIKPLPGIPEVAVISLLAAPVFYLFFHNSMNDFLMLFMFWTVFVAVIWIAAKRSRHARFNITVAVAMIAGLYSLYFITVLSQEKTTENLKIQAVSLSTENDPEAEHILLDMWPVISSDQVLKNMMLSERFNTGREDFDRISTWLSETYFTGYLDNYNLIIILCSDREMLRVGSDTTFFENCFDFFDSKIELTGQRLTGTGFYFTDNQNGRAHYLGRLLYETGNGATNGLFIELYSDVNLLQPGYSELLVDKKYHKYAGLKNYSFVKYINGEMVLRTGDFAYSKTDAGYIDSLADYRIFNAEGCDHVLYRSGNSTVIISRPELKPGYLLISFAYLFAFILVFLNLIVLLMRTPSFRRPGTMNFRQKLQMSYIGILLFSFIMVGTVVSILTIREYQNKHSDSIREKLNSVYYELEQWLGNEDSLSSGWSDDEYASLNELLINISNTFNTDVNIYGLNGYLMATSRPEIFFRNLISQRINNVALINMRDLTRNEYFQQENIGKLEYISAYIPLYNNSDQMLAYLNLPYFRMQSALASEISNLVVVVMNFTFLLVVIAMSLSVIISGRLTAPLAMLSERLASVGVGRKSEYLSYKSEDEIGDLVRKYNNMVDEIEESAKKLAFSEREYAWREMAKQIAHEIKNPLTPMKLNVQLLLKSWRNSSQGFDARIESFSKNQIEYIDNLSTIATAFSSFAKMPGNNPSDVDLKGQIQTSLELYRNTENVTFKVSWPVESRITVYADREQLNGVFSNLIKNAIQSIPANEPGIIEIGIEVKGARAIVKITDNGAGIPEGLKEKMFTPNFTTKSSGMGLGLSIAKRYVENAGGNIWFESHENAGTSFFIDFPIKHT
ncbi:MAG: HAMP domain-containing histidine kinase [Bacteroidales bacterium]|jgi:signal transduction histidine kinase|nr:HAMP domain-containing histidine kinase [Bacteroidales bacterium]